MTKISVIIPVYNAEMYLKDTLNCLFNQTLKDIEVICINDNSKDSSLEILKEYAKTDDRLKIIDLKENKGAAVARNKGLEIAQGEYLGFVDSDDEIDLNFYEELYYKAIATGADIVKAGCKITNLDGSVNISDVNNVIAKTNKYRFTWQWWCAIYKKSFVDENSIKFPDECIKGQDSAFLNEALLKSNRLELVDNVFYNYKRRENSVDSKELSLDKIRSVILVRNYMMNNLNNSDLFEKDRESYNFLYNINMNSSVNSFFRTSDVVSKKESIKNIIDIYNGCKDKKYLEENFTYPLMLDLLRDKKYEELSEFLMNCKNKDSLKYMNMNFLQNLFSIQKYGKYKLLTILGIRLKLK